MQDNNHNVTKDYSIEIQHVSYTHDDKFKQNHSLFANNINIEQNSGNLGDDEEFQDTSIGNFYIKQQHELPRLQSLNSIQNTAQEPQQIIFFSPPPNSAQRNLQQIPLIKLGSSQQSENNKNPFEYFLQDTIQYGGDNTPTVQNDLKTEQSEFTQLPFNKQKNSILQQTVVSQINNRKRISSQQNENRSRIFLERENDLQKQRKQRLAGVGKSYVVRNVAKLFDDIKKRKIRMNMVVRGFLRRLESLSRLRKATNLKEVDYEMINDKACYQKFYSKDQDKYSSYKFLTKRKKGRFNCKFKVHMPTDLFVIYWGVFSHIFFYAFLFIYSVLIFFAPNVMEEAIVFWYFSVACGLQFFDILVKLNTAYFNKDIIVKKRKLIAMRYIKQQFFFDIISLFVVFQKLYQYHFQSITGQRILVFDILGLIKIFSLNSKQFRQVIIFRESTKHLLKLLDLILDVVLAAHILSICWFQLHEIQEMYGVQKTWMQKYGIDDKIGLNCYVYSLYWAVTTMTTVGYGDITPSNTQEALFTIITMIIMSCVFAYSINNVGMILKEIQKSSTELNSEINTISKQIITFINKNEGLQYNKINFWQSQFIILFIQSNKMLIQIKIISTYKKDFLIGDIVRHYLTFLSEEQKERNKEAEDLILNKLSNKLRSEITNEINQNLLIKTPIFIQNFGPKTINRLLQLMQEIVVAPNEVIFNENQSDDFSMYFIQSGQIQIYHSTNSNIQVVKTLNNMQIFGEISFFSGLARKASAKSVGLSTLIKVSREDFMNILSEQQEDFETYKMIQEKIIFQNDYSQINTECYQCGFPNHLAKNCYVTHYSYDPVILSLRQNFSIPQTRKKADRRKKNKEFHPWFFVRDNQDIQLQLKQLHENDNSKIYRLFNYSDLQQSDCYIQDSSLSQDENDQYEQQDQFDMNNQTSFSNIKSMKLIDGSRFDATQFNSEDNIADKINSNMENRKKIFSKQRKNIVEDFTNKSSSSTFGSKTMIEQKDREEGSINNYELRRGSQDKHDQTIQNKKIKQDKINLDKNVIITKNQSIEVLSSKLIQTNQQDYFQKYQSLNHDSFRRIQTSSDNLNFIDQKNRQQVTFAQKNNPQSSELIYKEEEQDPSTGKQYFKSILNARKSVFNENNEQNVSTTLADLVLKQIHKASEKQSILELNMDYFETMKNFKKFFIHNNFEWVLRSYNKLRRKKRERIQKMVKKSHVDARTHNKINDLLISKRKLGYDFHEHMQMSHLQYGVVSRKSQNRLPARNVENNQQS